jgi:hypothetical protein
MTKIGRKKKFTTILVYVVKNMIICIIEDGFSNIDNIDFLRYCHVLSDCEHVYCYVIIQFITF